MLLLGVSFYLAVPVGDSDHWAITGTARQNDPLQQYYMLLLGGSFYLAVPVGDSNHWAIRRQTGAPERPHIEELYRNRQ